MGSLPHEDPNVRHDGFLIFEVVNSNPNGDPDAGNQPRQDIEDGHGLVTDLSLKRKIRDAVAIYVAEGLLDPDRYSLHIQAGLALNTSHERAFNALPKSTEDERRQWMCDHCFDVRMFGAVMTTGSKDARNKTAGRVRGPLQFEVARSVEPIFPKELGITRVVKTEEGKEDQGEMGSKWIVPHALYAVPFHYTPAGNKTGADSKDLGVVYQGLHVMWDLTRSAGRGDIRTRGLYVFSHSTAVGEARAWQLMDLIKVKKTSEGVARSWEDYKVDLPGASDLPDGITFTDLS